MQVILTSLIIFTAGLYCLQAACPFHTPFWFKQIPELQPVLDEFGNTIPDKVWIKFGQVANRKCVDYFKVEYTKQDKDGTERVTSPKVPRAMPGTEITVVPCTLYTFRVAAYEEFQGTGKRFKKESQEVNFTLDYTPKFIRTPLVYEKVGQPRKISDSRRERREIFPYTTTPTTTTEEPYLAITVAWDLSYVDFPICLARVEFHYLNIEWEESSFTQEYSDFKDSTRTMAFVVSNKQLPCDPEFLFTARVFGVNGQYTNVTWDPPSCVSTTPEPTTPPPTVPEFKRCHSGASFVFLYLFCT